MTWNPFGKDADSSKLKGNVVTEPANAPEAKDTSLRAVLRKKLIELAESGDIAAIRELLSKPELLSDEKPQLTTVEDVMEYMDQEHERERRELLKRCSSELVLEATQRKLREILETGRKRSGLPEPTPPTFESMIEARLAEEGNQLGLRAFLRMNDSERAMIWRDLSSELGLLGKELEAAHVVVQ